MSTVLPLKTFFSVLCPIHFKEHFLRGWKWWQVFSSQKRKKHKGGVGTWRHFRFHKDLLHPVAIETWLSFEVLGNVLTTWFDKDQEALIRRMGSLLPSLWMPWGRDPWEVERSRAPLGGLFTALELGGRIAQEQQRCGMLTLKECAVLDSFSMLNSVWGRIRHGRALWAQSPASEH